MSSLYDMLVQLRKCGISKRPKIMVNKNLFNSSGTVSVLNVTYAEPYKWMNVFFNLEDLKDVFQNCMIFIENCEMFVFITLPDIILLALQKILINTSCSVSFDEIDQLLTLYGFNHTYLIYWNTDKKCRVIHKCSNSENIFKCVSQIKHAHSAPIFKVSFHSLMTKRRKFSSDIKGKTNLRNLDVYTVNYVTQQKKRNNLDKSFIQQQRIENKHVLDVSRKTVPLKVSRKVIPARKEHPFCVRPMNGEYPSQVSNDSASAEVHFNTRSFPIPRGFMGIGHLQESTEPIPPFENNNIDIGRVSPRYPGYKLYSNRLATYSHWPKRHPSPTKLCEAGFFYTNHDDQVRCYQCGIGLRDFTDDDDDPLLEHVKHSESCEYLLDYLGPTALHELKSRLRYQNTEEIRQSQQERRSDGPELRYYYRHPEFCTYEARMKTFSRWPRTLIQTPERLASAGLYYTGFEDHVRCFACDGGLRKWDPEDDPWTEHCRWFPACPFAREQKGDEYIALIQASVEDENSSAGGMELTRAVEQMSLRDPQIRRIMNENKQACLDMGFKEQDFIDTIQELRDRGKIRPTLEDIVDNIAIVVENREAAKRLKAKQNETPEEENKRLRSIFICMICEKNKVNTLFLPCTHHRLCKECAESLKNCPVCGRNIREKIKTYLG